MATQRAVIVVGGGLAGGLVALRLKALMPDLELLLIEQGDHFGGSHTWSFHGSDLPAEAAWVLPLVSKSWPGYSVSFPHAARYFPSAYHAIRSPDFHRRVEAQLGSEAWTRVEVASLRPGLVTLADGRELRAQHVVDARGFAAAPPVPCGYQKFFGLVIKTAKPHGLTSPILMDATVDQLDGYRFVYVLPWSDTQLLVEDTYYSDSPRLNRSELRRRVEAYAAQQTWGDFSVLEEEAGVLPIPLHGALAPTGTAGVVGAGVLAGLYHPTTGYSLPEAARFAEWFAGQIALGLDPALLSAAAAHRASEVWQRGSFCRRLNSMMFVAARPLERRRIMAQFYLRGSGLIERFYAGTLRPSDRLRLLSGRPPVSLMSGLKAFFMKSAVG